MKKWTFRGAFGPGFLTGAADDDPSGIVTYAEAGARFGYGTLWTMLLTWPIMVGIQEMCARIALTTKKGISANLRQHFPVWATAAAMLLVAANIVNIAADLLMVATSARLVIPLDRNVILLIFSMLIVCLEIFLSYKKYSRLLLVLSVSLLAYPMVTLVLNVDWPAVLYNTFIPNIQFNSEWFMFMVALIGTTSSPYLFYWQSAQEIEESKFGKIGLGNMRLDTVLGMGVSNLVAWFIIIAGAAIFWTTGTDIESPRKMVHLIEPLAGQWASLLFALGIVGTGLLAVPVLAGASAYALSELAGWSEGLDKKWFEAKAFYGVILGSTLAGVGLGVLGFKPIQLLIASAVFNGLCGGPILAMLLLLANKKDVMGEKKNRWLSNVVNGLALLMILASSVAFLASQV